MNWLKAFGSWIVEKINGFISYASNFLNKRPLKLTWDISETSVIEFWMADNNLLYGTA